MKTNSQLMGIGAMALATLLASCGSNLETTRVPMSASSSVESNTLVGKLDQSLTQYRRSIGKDRIERNAALDRLAQMHCEFMAANRGNFTLGSENISHHGFEARALVAQRGYGMEQVAENVAGGRIQGDIATGLTKAWAASKKHAYNLKQDWNATGLAVHVTPDGMIYATQIFATKRNSQMALTDRFRQF